MIDIASLSAERPVLIAGPTASGKSAIAMEIAAHQGGVIVNADALQVYAGWRVLTARPTARDEAVVPHALYGHVPFEAAYSVGDWVRAVRPMLRGPIRPIIVGGTGLYFRALIEGLANIPAIPPDIRAAATAQNPKTLLAELVRDDPAATARLDPRNPARIRRAWEVWRTTGRPLSTWQAETAPPDLPLTHTQAFVVEADRDWLNARIARRFDYMLANGALDEARANLPHWPTAGGAAKAIGAAALIAHLKGDMTLDAARNAAIIATRQYAKKQRTWFRARMATWTPIYQP